MSTSDTYPLAAEGGVNSADGEVGNPFAQLDDLMQVIEALCPIYPQRATFEDAGEFKL